MPPIEAHSIHIFIFVIIASAVKNSHCVDFVLDTFTDIIDEL